MKSFLQTEQWLEFQKFIGRKTWRFDNGKIKANIIRHDLPFKKSYLYIPHGPEINFDQISGGIKNELAQFVSYLKNLARENNFLFVKIEPLDDKVVELIYQFGFKKSKKEIQPHRSVLIDLTRSQEELLSEMHHKTRYNIRLAEKKGLTFAVRDDLDSFWKLLKHTSKNDNFSTHEFSYYKKLLEFVREGELKVKTVFIDHEGKPIAGVIILEWRDVVYYLHGAMDRKYKPLMAPYLMHWEIIKQAKIHGFNNYDLWGIDARVWPGVTRFKLGWGGREVEYPGSFDLPISKFWYLMYKVGRKIF